MTSDTIAAQQSGAFTPRPFVIGLTGPIASGKSTIADRLRQLGAQIVDADRVYRSLLTPRSDLWRHVVARFGPTIIAANGEIDRAVLGKLVFGDPAALADLDRITHPAVVTEIRSLIERSAAPVLVIEAVKLIQSGLVSDTDSLWFVTANPETRARRLMARSGLDEMAARARIAAAPGAAPDDVRIDVTIDNSGDSGATLRAVDDAWRTLIPYRPNGAPGAVMSSPKELS